MLWLFCLHVFLLAAPHTSDWLCYSRLDYSCTQYHDLILLLIKTLHNWWRWAFSRNNWKKDTECFQQSSHISQHTPERKNLFHSASQDWWKRLQHLTDFKKCERLHGQFQTIFDIILPETHTLHFVIPQTQDPTGTCLIRIWLQNNVFYILQKTPCCCSNFSSWTLYCTWCTVMFLFAVFWAIWVAFSVLSSLIGHCF